MIYKRVEGVYEEAGDVEVEIFFEGVSYIIRRVSGELKIVSAFQRGRREDPYYPEDTRPRLTREQKKILLAQAAAIIKSRQE